MANKWEKVKSKIKDRDLDAEFEKFLNESLSDESLASPKRKLSIASPKKQNFDKPWWATSEDEDAVHSEAANKKWIKSKQKLAASVDDDVDGVDDSKPPENPLAISKDSLDVNSSRPGTALDTILSESEPSSSEKPVKVEDNMGDYDAVPDGIDEYSNDSFTGTSDEKSSQASVTSGNATTSSHHQAGMETLEELKDKEMFFSKLEEENDGGEGEIDYGKLNRELDVAESVDPPYGDSVDEAGEVLGLQAYRPPHYDDESSSESNQEDTAPYSGGHESHHSQSHFSTEPNDEQKSESHKEDRGASENPQPIDDDTLNTEVVANIKKSEIAPSSLLSKVTLMESLDSTAGLNLADKLAKMNAQIAAKESPPKKSLIAKSQNADESYLRTGDTSIEFAAALSNVRQLSTQSFDQKDDKVLDDINEMGQSLQPGYLLLDKEDEKEVNPFDLKPVISNFMDEPKIPMASSRTGQSHASVSSALATKSELNQLQTFSDINDLIADAMVDHLVKEAQQTHEDVVSSKYSSKVIHSPPGKADIEGFSLQPIEAIVSDDSPPTDSLKSIKSIAEEKKRKMLAKSKNFQKVQQDIKRVMSDERIDGRKVTKRKGSDIPKKRSIVSSTNVRNTKNQSSPSLRKTKEQPKSKPPKPNPQKRKAQGNSSLRRSDHLMESIEMLTTSLQEFREDTDVALNSTLIDKSFTRDRSSHLNSLQRERDLQNELRDLRLNYDELLNNYEVLCQQNSLQQAEFSKKTEQLSLDRENQLKNLKEEVFVLKNKLELSEKDRKAAMDLKIRSYQELSKQDVEHLQKQLEQQESLLNGYQQENERLYGEVKGKTQDMKKIESKMFEENQKLASEVGNLKEDLQNRPKFSSMSSSATVGATKITQLENQVKFYKNREEEHKQQILNLKNEVLLLKAKLSQSEQQRNSNVTNEGLLKTIEEMKSTHNSECEKLHKKLKWYSENQELLDSDMALLKDKRNEIKELRELVDRFESENTRLRKEMTSNQSDKNSNNTIIMDLKRQVKEMEEVIRRRHPNSLPALIYAASAVPGKNKTYESIDNQTQNKNLNAFLEKRVKTLEKELEDQDEENSRKVRAIEQQYQAMTLRYEEHVKQLEDKLNEISLRFKSSKTIGDLESELLRQKEEYDEIIESLKNKITEIQSKHSLKELGGKKITKVSSNIEKKEIMKLKKKLTSKTDELEELKSTLYLLQSERESLLSEQHHQQPISKKTQLRCADRGTSPLVTNSDTIGKCRELELENRSLRQKIEEIKLETKEKLLRQDAKEAQILSEKRLTEENLVEQLKLTEETGRREIEKLKMQYAIDHSNSTVAELNAKLKSSERMTEHLNQLVGEAKSDREKLNRAHITEENLRKEIIQLQDELSEARKHHTPEMHHYKMLESKIANMESRHSMREQELQNLVQKNQSKNAAELTYVEDKWRELLRDKDLEIMKFREELDAILEVLRELKRQGIILPVSNYQHAGL